MARRNTCADVATIETLTDNVTGSVTPSIFARRRRVIITARQSQLTNTQEPAAVACVGRAVRRRLPVPGLLRSAVAAPGHRGRPRPFVVRAPGGGGARPRVSSGSGAHAIVSFFMHHEFAQSTDNDGDGDEDDSDSRSCTQHRSFWFTPASIARVKAAVALEGRACTMFEALAGFVWSERRGYGGRGGASCCSRSMGGRGLRSPWGTLPTPNVIVPISVACPAGELASSLALYRALCCCGTTSTFRSAAALPSPERRRGGWKRKSALPTGSAASPTASSATSSPSSPPKTAPARRSSPPGGATYGAPLLSTSTSTTTTQYVIPSIRASDISHILSAHPGPCRGFVMPRRYMEYPSCTTLGGWLRSPLLDNLQELDFNNSLLLPSVRRFSSTLCVARFRACRFPDGNEASLLQLPLLKQLTLFAVDMSESSLHALLACCYFTTADSVGCKSCPRASEVSVWILVVCVASGYNSSSLRTPRVWKDYCILEELKASVWGHGFQGATIVSMSVVVSSVKVLALYDVNLCLDALINLFKCFPHLQKLYIEIKRVWGKDWCTYRELDIGIRKIVLRNYRGNKSHINLASFFVSNARVLESMRFEIEGRNVSTKWIGRQHRLLQIKKRAPRGAQFDFVSPNILTGSPYEHRAEQVHDL
ncbi:uncharacterized protein [Miscanthus floridulus]|uniref:uncharacterized protein n=1 Tax=Miscanthus floridulus TaxID=154761 RepID=UPI0034599808